MPIIEKNVAIGRETVRELEKVRGPKKDMATLRQHVAVVREMHALGDREAEAARQGNRTAFKDLTAQEDALLSKLPGDERFEGC